MEQYLKNVKPVEVDIPVEVELTPFKKEPLQYILAVKDSMENKEFGHYSLAQLIELDSNVTQAYEGLPEHAKPFLMNQYISIWDGLLKLKEKKGYSPREDEEVPTRKPKR